MNNILSAQPGEYIKGAIIANVSGVKAAQTKAGKTFFKATLTDGVTKVYATSWTQTFEHVDGKRVQFSGPGMKRSDDYQNTPQITFGEKVVFKPVSEATPTQTAPAPEEPRKIEANAASGPSRIEGVTVGMAVNKAVDILVAKNESIGADDVWQTASMLIRVAQKLQEGHLAPVMATNEVPSEEVPF